MRIRPGLAALLACIAGACAYSHGDDGAVTATAEAFLADQRAGAWDAAFARLHVNLQRACGSWQRMRDRAGPDAALPQHWTLRTPRTLRYTARLAGEVQRYDGARTVLELAFDRVDSHWEITAWSSGGVEPCR